MDPALATFLTVISAATPLLLAAMGELVVERSGVLNLGVEGMMLAGAVAGFVLTLTTGSATLGILAAALAGSAAGTALRRPHDLPVWPTRSRPGSRRRSSASASPPSWARPSWASRWPLCPS